MEYKEEDYLPLSGIQHFAFCRRQWALIHIEEQWQENLRTTEGKLLHQRAHDPFLQEKRGNSFTSRGVRISSRKLGLHGICDVVEFVEDLDGITISGRQGTFTPIPIEYKRGKPKEDYTDALQLCAQAMCLEEMLLCNLEYGYIYYGETRRRHKVNFTPELRQQVMGYSKEMHDLYQRRHTPKVKPRKNCRACSLYDLCMPKLCGNLSVLNYIEEHTKDSQNEETA